MGVKKAAVTQAAIARALKACRDAGLPVLRFEVGADGSVKVYTSADAAESYPNPCDRLLR